MSDRFCTFPGNREEVLVSYLYDDIAPHDRNEFEAHLSACVVCQAELNGLGGVRTRLADWAPPEPSRGFSTRGVPVEARPGLWNALREIPVWMQTAAALLFLGISAGAANLDIQYTAAGLAIHTGWLRGDSGQSASGPSAGVRTTAAEPAVSRIEIAAVERRLREEMAARPVADPELLREVRQLIANSEKKQQNELALQVAAVALDFQNQRRDDLARFDRVLKTYGNSTVIALERQQKKTDDINMRLVSLTQRQ